MDNLNDRARGVLEELRYRMQLTRDELARFAGCSPSLMSGKLNGTTKIGLEDIKAYCEIFTVDPSLFVMPLGEAVRWILDNADQLTARVAATAQAGFVELPYAVTIIGSIATAMAGARFPALALWFAENQRSDETYVHHHEQRSTPARFCHSHVTNPTLGAITVYRPGTHSGRRAKCNLYMATRAASAAERLGSE